MSWFSDKWVVSELDKDAINPEWVKGDIKYPIMDKRHMKNKNHSTALFADSKQSNFNISWMDQEDSNSDAEFLDLVENHEAHTMYNGSNIWNMIYQENMIDVKIDQQYKKTYKKHVL